MSASGGQGGRLWRDRALVLRTQRLGEADRIITLLAREHGQVRAVAKGVRRSRSKFGARLEPFAHVDLQVHPGRSLSVVTQVESLAPYGSVIVTDYARYTAGSAILETAWRLTDEGEPARALYALTLGAVAALASGAHEAGLVLDAFLLRALTTAGYAPSFDECVRCGRPGPHRWLAVAAGGVLCAECRVPGSVSPALETVTLLGALLAGQWDVADASEPRARREAAGITAAYAQWHLEHAVRALRLVDRGADQVPDAAHEGQ
ncbi:MAG: DNA repair protein RecO [Actinomycetes bacterium]